MLGMGVCGRWQAALLLLLALLPPSLAQCDRAQIELRLPRLPKPTTPAAAAKRRLLQATPAPAATVAVGDTLTLLPPANRRQGATPVLFWLAKGACPRRPRLQHAPATGVVRLSPAANRPGARLQLTFDAPGTYFYSMTWGPNYNTTCQSRLLQVVVKPRPLGCPPLPRGDCNYDGSSAASGGAPTPACFCRGLVGFFPNTRNGCSRAWACTGLEGIGGVEFGCPAGQAFSAQRERCVPTANALCGPPSAFFGGGFIGAWPDAQPPPTLDNVPVSRPFYYILSFAREGAVRDGVFAPVWDTWGPQLTPQRILAAKLADPNRRFMLSIAGWGHEFGCPANRQLWLANAVNSLNGLAVSFHLDGIDVNYEGCPLQPNCPDWSPTVEACFSDTIGAMLEGLQLRNPALFFTISPYTMTLPAYRQLMQAHGQAVSALLYQPYVYAYPTDTTWFVRHLHEMGTDPSLGGYRRFTWGVCTTGGDKWRGLQTPYIYDAYRGLRARGLQGFFTWSLEDSSHRSPPFDIEATLQQLS